MIVCGVGFLGIGPTSDPLKYQVIREERLNTTKVMMLNIAGSVCLELQDELDEKDMREIPLYAKSQVDQAGAALVGLFSTEAEMESALAIINNWRSCHSVPLNIFRRTLRQNCEKIDRGCLIAQRIKRLSSISHKLERFPTMKLSQMQDIGGCRAVVSNARLVRLLLGNYERSQTQSKIVDIDDYLENPKQSGYRGVHLIYRYFSSTNEEHNGLKIEIQLRSKLQHAWATAVETVGTFIKQALKSSQVRARRTGSVFLL